MTDPRPDFKLMLNDLLEEQSQQLTPLSPAELAAWQDGGLDEEARVALQRRMVLDREAVRGLLQAKKSEADAEDAAQSWARFRAKLEDHKDPEEGPLAQPLRPAARAYRMVQFAAAALLLISISLAFKIRLLEQQNRALVLPSLNVSEFTLHLGESGERGLDRPIVLGAGLSVLRLDLSGSKVDYLSYSVSLLGPDGALVFEEQKSADDNQQLTFSLHQGFLSQVGVYQLEVAGIQNGERVPLKKIPLTLPRASLERPGKQILGQFKLSGEKVHVYQLELVQGEFARVEAEQNGVDIRLDLYSPQGARLFSLNAEPELVNVEALAFIAESSGTYLLEIIALDSSQEGDYRLSFGDAHLPTGTDLAQVAAYPHIVAAQTAWYADDWPLAHKEMETAWLRLKQAGETPWQVRVLNKLGTLSSRQGQVVEAINYYDQALALSGPPSLARAELMRNKAYVYRFAGAFDQAITLLNEAGRIEEKFGTARSQAIWNNHMGTAYLKWGKPEEAIPYLEKAAESVASLEPIVRLRLAQAYITMDIEAGPRRLKYHERAFSILNQLLTDHEEWRPVLLYYRGLTQDLLGKPNAALEDLQAAATAFAERQSNDELLNALMSMARVEIGLNHRAAAREQLEGALALLEDALKPGEGFFLSKDFLASRYRVVDLLSDLVLSGDNQDEWAQLLVRLDGFRARSLLETLTPSDYEGDAGAAAKARNLSAVINRKEWQLTTSELSKEKADELESAISLDLITYNQLHASARHWAPPAAEAGLSLAKIWDLLGDDDLLLYFVMGERRVWLLALDQHKLSRIDLGPRAAIERDVRSYMAYAGQRQHRLEPPELGALKRRLAGLVPQALLASTRAKSLVILADGVLQDLPFAALEDAQGNPLIERCALVYLPSLASLSAIRARQATSKSDGKLIVFANPEQSGNLFGELPYALEEAERITALLPNYQLISGASAHRGQVFSEEFKASRVIHFATHGLFHRKHAELSALILADVDPSGQACDPFLRVEEIAHLQLSAELVVLSACETGLGEHVRGEGVLGLPSAFLQAGAASVLASLWRIDDEATMVLMEHFYRNLKTHGPAQALQLAQRAMARSDKWSAAYYWAGFRLLGDWDTAKA